MIDFGHLRFGRKPGVARLSNRMSSVLLTVKECITGRRLFPALILIYSSVDVLGSLQNPDGYASRQSFKNWVTGYLFRAKTFLFNEDDFYGARCGIVHTMRYDSERGAALKTIVYGFHGYDNDIKKITDNSRQAGVYVEDLLDALRMASVQYLDDLQNSSDPILNANLDKLPDYVDLIPLN